MMNIDYTKYKFISDGTWFDKGTEAKFICFSLERGLDSAGLFEGIKDGYTDQESCCFDEFWIYDENDKLMKEPEEE